MRVRLTSFVVVLTLLVSTLVTAYIQAAPPLSPANGLFTAQSAELTTSAPATIIPTSSLALAPIGNYTTGAETAAEIATYDPVSATLFVTNAFSNTVDLFDISDPADPTKTGAIDLAPYGAGPNSVDFFSYGPGASNGLLAVAVEADPKVDPGKVLFFDRAGAFLDAVTVGALPDMVTFTPDGRKVLVANEGEPNDDYSVDPEGSISIIDVGLQWKIYMPVVGQNGIRVIAAQTPVQTTNNTTVAQTIFSFTVRTAAFTAFNDDIAALRASGVRIFGPNATVAQDLEPEYIAVSPDGQTAYVTLQENNALAVVDVDSAEVSAVLPLGFKDHSQAGNAFDASDRDDVDNSDDQPASGVEGTINIRTWPVLGMYQPDAIAAYQAGGQLYLVTANEGDARDYAGYSEEERVSDITLDPAAFPNAAELQADANLGRLRTTSASGDTDGDGNFDQIYAFGARSFTIWNAATGAVVYDSGSDFEQITAATDPATFNSQGDGASFDTRSDDKGPEPEGVDVGQIGDRTYAFIGLERVGGVMVYDITEPTSPAFVQYVNSQPVFGDRSPEGVKFIPADESPSGSPLLVVTFEVSGSVTVFEISTNPDGAGRLTLLHNNDGESSLLPIQYSVAPGTGFSNTVTETLDVGGVAAFKTLTDQNIAEARADSNSVLNVYAGDAFLASATLQCSLDNPDGPVYDALAQRQIPYDAHTLGNHEFDYSPDFLERFIRAFQINGKLTQPFLGANLDFSGEPGFNDLVDADGLLFEPVTDGRVIARALITTDQVTGQRFGVVGMAPYYLRTISSPRNVVVTADDLASTATLMQQEIDRLYDEYGVRKIILVNHLQDIDEDQALIPLLRRVDLAVAGGGDELLVNSSVPQAQQLLPGETAPVAGEYPLAVDDADGRTVYIVTTAGNYKYLGRLDVTFDSAGEISAVITDQSYPRRVIPTSPVATTLGLTDTVVPDPAIVSSVNEPVEACLNALAEPIIRSEVLLDVSRNGVRGSETNAGNLVADSYLYAYAQLADENGLPPISAENPVIAIQNGGGIRQNAGDVLPVGGSVPDTISRLDTRNVLAFFNTMTVVQEVTPAELKQIFERSVSSPGGGQFLQIAGLEIVYNPANTAQVIATDGTVTTEGERVVSITLDDGTPIVTNGAVEDGAPNVSIVTNTFTADGGDNYPWLAANSNKTQLFDTGGLALTYEQTWVDYMLSFSASGNPSLPTIPDSDPRYQPGGEGRITTTGTP